MNSVASTDIDIDVVDRARALRGLPHVAATNIDDAGKRRRHNSGVYLQDIPVHPLDGSAAWDKDEATAHGFFKIDLLSSHSYQGVRDEAHLDALMAREPIWELLLDEAVTSKLSQINKPFAFKVIEHIRPQNVEDLAVVISLIRPAKKHLAFRPRHEIDANIWRRSDDGEYFFKRSHAIAYAMLIVVQLNLMVEQCAE